MDIYIYALLDPRSGNPFYVGKTNNLKVRLKDHRSGRGRTKCAEYIRGVRDCGLRISLEILEMCSAYNWCERERYWIDKISSKHEIVNTSDGGQPGGFFSHSEITKKRLSETFKGRPISQEQKEQISKSLTGLKQSPETVLKRMSTINANRVARGLDPLPVYANQDEYLEAKRIKSMLRRRELRRQRGALQIGSPEWKENLAAKAREQHARMTPEEKESFRAARRKKRA